jgi:hypothetical protein
MAPDLSAFAARARGHIDSAVAPPGQPCSASRRNESAFDDLAVELFALQFARNPAYRVLCEKRGITPRVVARWNDIPAVPSAAFKECEMTSLAPEERARVFHSSGTTGHRPSRHFHSAESLALYETSLWAGFRAHLLADPRLAIADLRASVRKSSSSTPDTLRLMLLTPGPAEAPNSSLAHMFETVRRSLGEPEPGFIGGTAGDGSWTLDCDAAAAMLRAMAGKESPCLVMGTAFSFVHLLDFMAGRHLHFELPAGSRVMETGGYKGRSRALSKTELYARIAARLGVSQEQIFSEYGMSELSSQAYDVDVQGPRSNGQRPKSKVRGANTPFHFPPWARFQIVSPESGCDVAEGETGLLRIYDLANVFSVIAIQTEDLAIRRGDGFELIGRAAPAELRGCSLMSVESLNR